MRDVLQERVLELLSYEPLTGRMYWLQARGNRASGSEAGCDSGNGYRKLRIDGQEYYMHRIIVLYMTGAFPIEDVDHINHNKSDNRWKNLRSVSRSENKKNAGLSSANTSGVVGVFWNSGKRQWTARIKSDGKTKHIGHFTDFHAAVVARKGAEIEMGFHANHGR